MMCYTGDWKDYLLKEQNGKVGVVIKTGLAIVAIGMFFLVAIVDNFRVHVLKKRSWIEDAWGFKVDEV